MFTELRTHNRQRMMDKMMTTYGAEVDFVIEFCQMAYAEPNDAKVVTRYNELMKNPPIDTE